MTVNGVRWRQKYKDSAQYERRAQSDSEAEAPENLVTLNEILPSVRKVIKMKNILFSAFLICASLQAQTPSTTTYTPFDAATSVQTPCTGACKPFEDVVAYILLPNAVSQQSLTSDETKLLRSSLATASELATAALNATADLQAKAIADSQAAMAALLVVQNNIAAAHGWDSSTSSKMPYQITFQDATVMSYAPAVWIKVAIQGQTVHLLKGTTIRYGAPAGSLRTYPADNFPLAVDSFTAPITLTADTDIVVSSGFLTSSDPAPGYVKEIDIQSGTGGATLE